MSEHEEHPKEHPKKHGGHGPPHGGGAHEEHEGAPEWLISFADNVTLMMGFFVILLAMNLKPADETGGGSGGGAPGPSAFALDMAIAIRDAFNNPVSIHSTDPNDADLVRRLMEQSDAIDHGAPGRKREVQSIRPGDYFGQGGVVPFEQDSAEMTEEGRKQAVAVAKLFRGLRLILEVRGHASAAEGGADPKARMRIGYERALAVGSALVVEGMDWRQLRLVSCGDNDRLTAQAYDEEGHRTNQRVEVTLLDETLPDEL